MPKRNIEVKSHQGAWKEKYKKEKKKLKKVFKDIFKDIYHIGSTAVPNIKAKPIIDIMVVVNDIGKVDQYNDKMTNLGYIPKGEFGIKNRRFFYKGKDKRTHHVHVFQKGDQEIEKHLNFRDYLIDHPQKACKYSRLKEKLAQKYSDDIDSYCEGKDEFIKEIDKKALKWAKEK